MPKLIREGRMGPPKVWKTGAVVSTYPGPKLVLEGDEGGLDIIQKPLEVTYISEPTLESILSGEAKPPDITAWRFGKNVSLGLTEEYTVTPNYTDFPEFNRIGNMLLRCPPEKFPFRTVIVDPITRLSDIIYGHNSAVNPGSMADARKWAANIGLKVQQTMAQFCNLPCHVVFILHTTTDKNELTSEIRTEPMIYSKFRELVGGLLSQFFYADCDPGEPPNPYVLTQPQLYVKGIGMRWPLGLPPRVGARFEDIYGKAIENGEIEV